MFFGVCITMSDRDDQDHVFAMLLPVVAFLLLAVIRLALFG